MQTLVLVLAGIIALQHIGFGYLEMVLWTKPAGRKTFHNTKEFAEASKVLAANQGLYNLFLAAGLIWGIASPAELSFQLLRFFLGCVLVAGIFGGITFSKRILIVQGVPAALALAALLYSAQI